MDAAVPSLLAVSIFSSVAMDFTVLVSFSGFFISSFAIVLLDVSVSLLASLFVTDGGATAGAGPLVCGDVSVIFLASIVLSEVTLVVSTCPELGALGTFVCVEPSELSTAESFVELTSV